MHRDTKLGLALAILVMGFAAALCFPRVTPETVHGDLKLATASELDAAIRMMPVRSYTESDGPRPAPLPAEVAAAPTPVIAPAVQEEFVPEPIALPNSGEPTLADKTGNTEKLVPPVEEVEPPAEVAPLRLYRVQSGDSLSRIAERELGSSTRWEELFQANRDVLSSADELKERMVLKIPARSVAPSAAVRSVPRLTEPRLTEPRRPDPRVSVPRDRALPPDDFSSERQPPVAPSEADRPAKLFRTPGRISSGVPVRPQ